MSALGRSILAAAELAAGPRGEWASRVSLGPRAADAVPLGSVDLVLDDWLATAAECRAGDARRRAAFLMGRIAFAVTECLGGPALDGLWLAAIPGHAVALRPRRVDWEEDGETGTDIAFDLWIDATALEAGSDASAFGAALETLLTPLVEGLHRRSRLARSALWREVADSLSASLLNQGKDAGRVEEAMAAATAVFRRKGLRFSNPQTGFLHVALPERPDISEWFRERGGCCRIYTLAGEDYCTTCVLRDRDSRTERLRDYLRTKHGLTS